MQRQCYRCVVINDATITNPKMSENSEHANVRISTTDVFQLR